MNAKLVTVVVALSAACASSSKTHGPPSACADELLQKGYVAGRDPQPSAEAYCAEANQAQLAIAKDLVDKHYQPDIGMALTTAKAYQPAEIACAKRETDAVRSGSPGAPLVVSDACQGVTFHTPAPAETVITPAVPDKSNNLLEALTAEGHCSKFLAAVDKVNLAQALKSGGPWTVFAPSNRAVSNIPGGFDALMKKPEALKRFVRAHLVDGVRSSSEIKPGGVKWPTADGRNVAVEKKGAITINKQARVIKADIPADNGLIYVIDTVLEP